MASTRFFTLLLVGAAMVLGTSAQAQELNCAVTVDRSAVSGTDFQFLDDLRVDAQRYLNERNWTNDYFEEHERIDCTVRIAFTRAEGLTNFAAQIVVGSSRPVYGTAQRTNVFQISDSEWRFTYTRGRPLIFDPSSHDDLMSVLDYYAYMILGYDYDTFSPRGGDPFFELARQVSTLAQSSGGIGWGGLGDDRTRTTLVNQLTDPRYAPLRQIYFDYHFNVLDRFVVDTESAWAAAIAVVANLQELYLEFNQRRYATDLFFSTKAAEIVRVFENAPTRARAYETLVEIDSPRQSTYEALVN